MQAARNVQFTIKTGKASEFSALFNTKIIPLLKNQAGFRNEVTLMHENHGIGISMWEDKGALERYEKDVYPTVLKTLTPLLEGSPTVKTYQVAASTLAV
jgi:quinol monooxygenase YgiN